MLFVIPWYAQVLVLAGVLAFSIYCHEYGHYHYLKRYYDLAQRPRFFFENGKLFAGVTWPTGVLSVAQSREVLLAGIILGLIPMLFLVAFITPLLFGLSIGLYFIGCRSDIMKLYAMARGAM